MCGNVLCAFGDIKDVRIKKKRQQSENSQRSKQLKRIFPNKLIASATSVVDVVNLTLFGYFFDW